MNVDEFIQLCSDKNYQVIIEEFKKNRKHIVRLSEPDTMKLMKWMETHMNLKYPSTRHPYFLFYKPGKFKKLLFGSFPTENHKHATEGLDNRTKRDHNVNVAWCPWGMLRAMLGEDI